MANQDVLLAALRQQGSVMSVNGLKVELNMPSALPSLTDGQGNEIAQGLPPYNRRAAFSVDEYPGCPPLWMRGAVDATSYFVPVLPEHGLWLDFNANHDHTHHVAALVSIQGINGITGQPSEGFTLEQYKENCPVHNTPLGAERFCEQCGFMWPAQNYLATTGTPTGLFWIDGFRAKDGVVRQFVFTEQTMRGIATQLIGDKRVFAIGIAFFLSKEPRPQNTAHYYGRNCAQTLGGSMLFKEGGHQEAVYGAMVGNDQPLMGCLDASAEVIEDMAVIDMTRSMVAEEPDEDSFAVRPPTGAVKKLEVAAGSRIDQSIYPDPEILDFWQEKPAGVIYINYVDEETARRIIEAGKKDLTAGGEGFMQNLQVGHK